MLNKISLIESLRSRAIIAHLSVVVSFNSHPVVPPNHIGARLFSKQRHVRLQSLVVTKFPAGDIVDLARSP